VFSAPSARCSGDTTTTTASSRAPLSAQRTDNPSMTRNRMSMDPFDQTLTLSTLGATSGGLAGLDPSLEEVD
jgi:hypothetical protein